VELNTEVRVVEDVVLYHVPKSRGKPFQAKGMVGIVVGVQTDEHLTSNRPILVKLLKAADGSDVKKFTTHFSIDELEILGDGGEASATKAATSASGSNSSGSSATDSAATASGVDALAMSASSEQLTSPAAGSIAEGPEQRWLINVLYDSKCPSCMKQVEFLDKRMDENPEYAGLVRLTDLHAPDYDPSTCGGVIFEDGMRHIHAVTRDGEVVVGMDVFRRVYSLVGMEWVYSITTLPVVGSLFDWLYDLWAEHRLLLSGHDDLVERVHMHQKNIEELSTAECGVECEIDWDNLTAPVPAAIPIRAR